MFPFHAVWGYYSLFIWELQEEMEEKYRPFGRLYWTFWPLCGKVEYNGERVGKGMIAFAQIASTLQPWLGNDLLRCMDDTLRDIHVHLCGYSTRHDPAESMEWIDRKLFFAIKQATDGRFLMQLPDNTWVRIRLEDIAAMADEVMYLLFDTFPADPWHKEFLQAFSLRVSSLSALRVLYTKMAHLQTEEELFAIARVIRECYPAFRWRQWLYV